MDDMYELMARLHGWYLWHTRPLLREEDGQATTEYALVMLGAALVALMLVGWATAGGGAGKIGRLFDRVIDTVIDKL
jgi:Flp pilus assembly pilin Flp